MSRTDDADMKPVSPFLISKAISDLVGTSKSIKKLATGSLLIETATSAQSTTLLQASALGLYPIMVEAHWQLNFSRGVISFDLIAVSTDEIAAELATQCVVAIQRIQSHRSGVLQPTASLILTFSQPTLPEKLNVAFYRLPVRPYVPNPMRCFNCQLFGHSQLACKSKASCDKYGKDAHDGDCSSAVHCVHCAAGILLGLVNVPSFLRKSRFRSSWLRKTSRFLKLANALRPPILWLFNPSLPRWLVSLWLDLLLLLSPQSLCKPVTAC